MLKQLEFVAGVVVDYIDYYLGGGVVVVVDDVDLIEEDMTFYMQMALMVNHLWVQPNLCHPAFLLGLIN